MVALSTKTKTKESRQSSKINDKYNKITTINRKAKVMGVIKPDHRWRHLATVMNINNPKEFKWFSSSSSSLELAQIAVNAHPLKSMHRQAVKRA